MAKAMQNEPSGLLSDFQVLGERRGGNALRVIGNQPNRHKPLAEREFRVFEDGPDLDRDPGLALATLERLAVAEMINLVAAAVRAKLAVTPPDRTQMVDAGLFVGERFHQAEKGVEIEHGCRPLY